MFGSIGTPELLVILVIALIVFGPRRLPELGSTIGKAIRDFRRELNAPAEKLDVPEPDRTRGRE